MKKKLLIFHKTIAPYRIDFFNSLNNPFDFFHFRKKHYGILPACMTFVSNWNHFLFPWLWKISYQKFYKSVFRILSSGGCPSHSIIGGVCHGKVLKTGVDWTSQRMKIEE